MKTLIVVTSNHKGNTEKIAGVIAGVISAEVIKTQDCKPETLKPYELIGFGSGIYGGRPDKALLELIGKSEGEGKKAFAVTTSGAGKDKYNERITEAAKGSGFEVLGGFASKGFCTWGPFKLIGGSAKGHPDEDELKAAKEFAKTLKV